ncbi:MAG: twin-arginine translocation signal domain-containing protein [Proteobacteria bacterium]|nr:twin-arginine translocation signal domain-containing protein [Pseudomonadota bacterium]
MCSSRRSFIKLSAASALSLGMAYAGAPMGNSIAAEPSRAVISPKPEMC